MMPNPPSRRSRTQSGNAESPANAPTLDVLFGALANQRRRHALQCLREVQTPIALTDLANKVATREQATPRSEIPAEEVNQVYMSLYQSHIPKLAEANIVEYTQEQDAVTLSTVSEHAKPFIEVATATE